MSASEENLTEMDKIKARALYSFDSSTFVAERDMTAFLFKYKSTWDSPFYQTGESKPAQAVFHAEKLAV